MNKDEKTAWWIVRGILALVVILFFALGVFGNHSGDETFLAARLTGTWADWLGSVMFIGGIAVMMNIIPGLRNVEGKYNVWMAVAMALGAVLFWNL